MIIYSTLMSWWEPDLHFTSNMQVHTNSPHGSVSCQKLICFFPADGAGSDVWTEN